MILRTHQIIQLLLIVLFSSSVSAEGVLDKYSAIHLKLENQIYDTESCITALEDGQQKSPTHGLCSVLNPKSLSKFNEEVSALGEEAENLISKAKKAGTIDKVLGYRIRGAQMYHAYLLQAHANQLALALAVDEVLKAKAESHDQ